MLHKNRSMTFKLNDNVNNKNNAYGSFFFLLRGAYERKLDMDLKQIY